MVYVKDEMIKFDADRIASVATLHKTKNDLEILGKITEEKFIKLSVENTKEKKELRN